MVASEEKQFILDHRPAKHSAKLVALQRIPLWSEGIACVQRTIAHEFEQIPVKFVGAGLGYSVNRRRRVLSVLGLQRAGLHFEFLEGIGKRQRQIQVVVRIVMRSSIEYVDQTIVQPAPHRNGVGGIIPAGSDRARSLCSAADSRA